LMIADQGLEEAAKKSMPLKWGVNVYEGKCTYPPVASTFGIPYTPVEELLG